MVRLCVMQSGMKETGILESSVPKYTNQAMTETEALVLFEITKPWTRDEMCKHDEAMARCWSHYYMNSWYLGI